MPPARLSPGPTLAQPPTIELPDYDTAGTTVRGGRASSRVMTLGLARTRDLPSPLSRLAGELPDAGPQPTRREGSRLREAAEASGLQLPPPIHSSGYDHLTAVTRQGQVGKQPRGSVPPARYAEPPAVRSSASLASHPPSTLPTHTFPQASESAGVERWPALPPEAGVDAREDWLAWERDQQHHARLHLEQRGSLWTA